MEERSPFLTVSVGRKSSSVPEEVPAEAPSLASAKRRKSKLLSSRRTNEELIQESHEELLRYVDSVEGRVRAIVQAHEGEFLEAYRQHVKKVRDEMEALRRQSSHEASSEQLHLERIAQLEKQLALFREESLKLFQKVLAREKENAELTLRLREAQADSAHSRKSLQAALRRNKDLEAALLKLQQKGQTEANLGSARECLQSSQDKGIPSEERRKALFSPFSKQLFEETSEKRPLTSAYGSHSKSLALGVHSNQKVGQGAELEELRLKLEEQGGSAKLVSVETVLQLLSGPAQERQAQASFRLAREKLYSKAVSRRRSSLRQDPLVQAQSEELAERTDYLGIFKRCVAEIKKEILRRNRAPSLNFFKQNGPRDFIEFKKVEHYLLLELFLRDDHVLRKFHELLLAGSGQ